ncbi:type I methionyl aminopeptidase [Nonomuraea ferruginea]
MKLAASSPAPSRPSPATPPPRHPPIAELDDLAATTIREAAATSAFLGYQPHFAPTPYPAVICVSVNDAIVHGIPGRDRLRDGDLVSVDCGAYLDGWAGDAAISFTVGTAHPADRALIDATRQALAAGIAAAVPGNRIGDIGHAIQTVAARGRYAGPADFGGHGIGRHMHEDPHVSNRGRPGRGMTLRPGMTLAIEPMLAPPAAATTASPPTAGPCAPPTAAAPPTPSTLSPSPTTAPSSSPNPDHPRSARPPPSSGGEPNAAAPP